MFKIIKSNPITLLMIILLSACSNQGNNSSSKSTAAQLNRPFVPPQEKQLLIIGQDSDTISEYIANMPEDNIEGVTLYSQLKSNDTNHSLRGIVTTANWNAGEVNFASTLEQSPNAALALGLAFDQCNQAPHATHISLGDYQETLSTLVNYLKSLAPRKVFLRIGYEFDGPWNCYDPESYKAAFRTIAQALRAVNANNVVTVWQSATWPDSYGTEKYNTENPEHFARWYPGDDVVDWVGISVFYRDLSNWNYTPPSTPAISQEQALSFARQHNKPVMIAESAPQGFRIGGLTQSPIQESDPESVTAEDIWQRWFAPYFKFIEDNKDVIRVVAYINTNWESQGMWHCESGIQAGQPGCSQGNWGDSRVHANEYIKSKWLEKVNDSSVWIQSSDY